MGKDWDKNAVKCRKGREPLYIVGSKMGDPANANILLFLAILGALVVVVTRAGGSAAYGAWAGQRVKSRQAGHAAAKGEAAHMEHGCHAEDN